MPKVRRAKSCFGESGRGSRGFYLQGVRRETSDALIGNCVRSVKRQSPYPTGSPRASRMRLAVEMRHLRRVVAGAGRELRRDCRIDACEIDGGEFEIEGVERLFELIAPPRAHHRQDVVAARAHPGERELRRACAFLVADLTERFDQPQI